MSDALTRWNQSRWNQLSQLEDGHTLGRLFIRSEVHWPRAKRIVHWIPLVRITEDGQGYLIKVRLPQVKKEDLAVSIEEGALIITGDRKRTNDSDHHQSPESDHGYFEHSFSLPRDISPAEVTAEFKGQILKIRLARKQEAKSDPAEPVRNKGATVTTPIL